MRQPSLFDLLKTHDSMTDRPPSDELEVYSYFAGAGGFCTGAAQAGCRVVYACDSCPLALETHRRNHPQTQHQCLVLPCQEAEDRLPRDGRRFHVHCSPPCTKFSQINRSNVVRGNRGAQGLSNAVDLIEWSFDMMLGSQCTSWSLEQVHEPEVVAIVERVRARHPQRVAYTAVDMRMLGVPQTRTRLLAAPPKLLAQLLRKRCKSRIRSVRQTLPMPRGTHLHSGCSTKERRVRSARTAGETKYVYTHLEPAARWAANSRPIDQPAYTVRGRHAMSWVTVRDGKAPDHSVLSARELAILQTFPADFKLPTRKFDACLQVGNAVPPLVARLLLEDEVARTTSPSLRRPPKLPRWA